MASMKPTKWYEREYELGKVYDWLLAGAAPRKIVSIYGNGGIGKSFLCNLIANDKRFTKDFHVVHIDFNYSYNISVFNVIDVFLKSIGDDFFLETKGLIVKFYESIDVGRQTIYEKIISSFQKELATASQKKKILTIIDTLEACSTTKLNKFINEVLFNRAISIQYIVSGKDKISHVSNEDSIGYLELRGIPPKDIQAFMTSNLPKLKSAFKSNPAYASHIYHITQKGNPILCGLLIDMLHNHPSQQDYILDVNKNIPEFDLIIWIRDLDKKEYDTLRILAYFPKRMNEQILGALLELESSARNILENIYEYSFIKYDRSSSNVAMHDVIRDLIKKHDPIGKKKLDKYVILLLAYYDNILSQKDITCHTPLKDSLTIEKFLYLKEYSSEERVVGYFEKEFYSNLDINNLPFCDLILNEFSNYASGGTHNTKLIFSLADADFLLAKNNSEEAFRIINELKNSTSGRSEWQVARINESYVSLIIHPCPISSENIFYSVKIINTCIDIYSSNNDKNRIVRAYYILAVAYSRIGYSDKAEIAIDNAINMCDNDLLKIKMLLEKNKIYRLQQKVTDSSLPLMQCKTVMDGLCQEINKGVYHYYLANMYRDLNDFGMAESYYNTALNELKDGNNVLMLCELYCDRAWMEYLKDDFDIKVLYRYLNLSWELARQYKFFLEYSEYYHIKYEIEHYIGNKDASYPFLEKALRFAVKYSNVYMILDCLNHLVQMHYDKRQFNKISPLIDKMRRYEQIGCGIRVFRGRAQLVYGDVLYDNKEYEKAFNEWTQGFITVALYGNSRTNVELFEDLYAKRKEDLKVVCAAIDFKLIEQFIALWYKERVSRDFDYFLEVMKKDPSR